MFWFRVAGRESSEIRLDQIEWHLEHLCDESVTQSVYTCTYVEVRAQLPPNFMTIKCM